MVKITQEFSAIPVTLGYSQVKCNPLLFFSCGSVIIDFEMKFNQSAVVSEVLNVLKTAAKEDNFGGYKVDPNSIEQISPAPTGTSSTKSTVSWFYFPSSFHFSVPYRCH